MSKMSTNYFTVRFHGDVEVRLDDAVIDAVTEEWRGKFYDLHSPEDIAQHIAYNYIANNARLSQLDGWADQPNSNAKVIVDWREWDIECRKKE